MGSTSSAEMSSTTGFLEDSVSLALFASDDIDITAGLGLGLDRDVDGACRAAIAEARSRSDRDPKICVVFADPAIVEPQRTLDALAAALPDGVVVVGGGSAWQGLDAGVSWQFCNERVTSEGVAVLLLSGPVAYSIAVGTGWRSLGAIGVITRSAPRQIDEIDGRPAVEFLARYLDVTDPAGHFGNPLAVREIGADESYLRAVTRSDASSGALSVLADIPVDSTVQLTTATTEDILSGTRQSLAAATADFPAGARPEAALMFSCVVRRMLLGSRASTEVALARTELGPSVALAGLYCYGEIGPIAGVSSSRYLNSTFVTLLLGT
jgi:hypothetical protein